MAVRVTVVEDSPEYRASLETFLRHAPGFSLAGSFGSALAAIEAVERAAASGRRPEWDLVLMDLEMPRMNGIEATRRLKELLPGIAVVVITVFEDPGTILEAIGAGADGYLLKKSSAPELAAQLGSIAAGGAPLTAGVARTVLELLAARASMGSRPRGPARLELTSREQDVLRCLVRGRSYQQAADDLGVGLETVRSHVKAVYRKLQVHTVAAAVSRAVRDGLV